MGGKSKKKWLIGEISRRVETEQVLPPPPPTVPDVGAGDIRSTSSVTIPEVEKMYRDREAQAQAYAAQLSQAQAQLQADQKTLAQSQAEFEARQAVQDNAAAAAGGGVSSGRAGRRRITVPEQAEEGDVLPELGAPDLEAAGQGRGVLLLVGAAALVGFLLFFA